MTYDPLDTDEIAPGKPTKTELFTKVQGNEADHETRILALEGVFQNPEPIEFQVVGGVYSHSTPFTGAGYKRIWTSITLTGARLYVPTAGSSGTLDVNLKMSAAGGGAFSTIFSTRPSLTSAAGNHAVSSNAVLSTTSLVAGDLLRLDVESAQTGCNLFYLYLTYEVSS